MRTIDKEQNMQALETGKYANIFANINFQTSTQDRYYNILPEGEGKLQMT